jgi:hypothetical protein
MVFEWLGTRGPVSGWTTALHAELSDARDSGNVDELIRDWCAHGEVGKALVRDLQGLVACRLPENEDLLRDIIRQAFELLSTLSHGIAVIEAHIGIFDV